MKSSKSHLVVFLFLFLFLFTSKINLNDKENIANCSGFKTLDRFTLLAASDPPLIDYVDNIVASGDDKGSISGFADMAGDDGKATYLYEDSKDYDMCLTFSFTSVDTSFNSNYLAIDLMSSHTTGVNIWIGTTNNIGSMKDLGTINTATVHSVEVNDYIGTTFYVKFVDPSGSDGPYQIDYLRLESQDTEVPSWYNESYMPSDGLWYSTCPVLNVRFADRQLYNGWWDVDDSTPDQVLFSNAYVSSWQDSSWEMSAWSGLSEGAHTLYFSVLDTWGNQEGEGGEWSWSFNKDTVFPGLPTIIEQSHIEYVWNDTNLVKINWSAASDPSPGSGIAGYSYSWTHGESTPDTSTETTGLTSTSPTLSSGDDWYFNLRSVDNMGLGSTTVHAGPFYIDTSIPNPPTIIEQSHIEYVWNDTNLVKINWSAASDPSPGSGIAGYSYSWTHGESTPDAVIDTIELSTISLPLSESDDWYFNIIAIDELSFKSSVTSIGPFKIDLFKPISNNPLDITLQKGEQYKNLTWIISDSFGSGYYRVLVDDIPLTNWEMWDNNSEISISINTDLVGIFTYSIEFNDTAGYWGVPDIVSITILSDDNPNSDPNPYGAAFFIAIGIGALISGFAVVNLVIKRRRKLNGSRSGT